VGRTAGHSCVLLLQLAQSCREGGTFHRPSDPVVSAKLVWVVKVQEWVSKAMQLEQLWLCRLEKMVASGSTNLHPQSIKALPC
jgi:hypothetical protein